MYSHQLALRIPDMCLYFLYKRLFVLFSRKCPLLSLFLSLSLSFSLSLSLSYIISSFPHRAHCPRTQSRQTPHVMLLYASLPLSLGSLSVKHVFALALLVCLTIVVKLLVMRRRGMRTMEPFPGPPAHWLIGHVKEVNNTTTNSDRLCS